MFKHLTAYSLATLMIYSDRQNDPRGIFIGYDVKMSDTHPSCNNIKFFVNFVSCIYLFLASLWRFVWSTWLRRWTQDLGVRGLIPAALVTGKNLSQALNPRLLCSPSSHGYQVE